MLRKLMLALPVGAFVAATTFTTTALYPRRCEAAKMEIDFVYYSDCQFTEAVGERDLQCNGKTFRWGNTSGNVFVKNYYSCEGKWMDCNSSCATPDGGYGGCYGGLGARALGCSSPKPVVPPEDDEGSGR